MPRVIISKNAMKQLKNLKGTKYYENMRGFIRELDDNNFPKGFDIIKVKKDQSIRVRFGKYRLFYEIDKKEDVIIVHHISLRKKAYK